MGSAMVAAEATAAAEATTAAAAAKKIVIGYVWPPPLMVVCGIEAAKVLAALLPLVGRAGACPTRAQVCVCVCVRVFAHLCLLDSACPPLRRSLCSTVPTHRVNGGRPAWS